MPYIDCQMTKKIGEEQKLSLEKHFGKSIELFPGIAEEVLMVGIQDNLSMYFRGVPADAAYVSVKIFKPALVENPDYDIVSKDIIDGISEITGTDADNIYITFEPIENWGRKNETGYML